MFAFRWFGFAVVYMVMVIMGGEARAQTTFWWPVSSGSAHGNCYFNSLNCYRRNFYHAGIDIIPIGRTKATVISSNVGVVHALYSEANSHGLGNCVIVKHAVVVSSNGNTANYYTLYGHLESFASGLRAGQVVNRGQTLGVMGTTGASSGVHLHFEVKTAGVLHNPYGSGQHWGYTPKPAQNYGFIDPGAVLNNWKAVPISR